MLIAGQTWVTMQYQPWDNVDRGYIGTRLQLLTLLPIQDELIEHSVPVSIHKYGPDHLQVNRMCLYPN